MAQYAYLVTNDQELAKAWVAGRFEELRWGRIIRVTAVEALAVAGGAVCKRITLDKFWTTPLCVEYVAVRAKDGVIKLSLEDPV